MFIIGHCIKYLHKLCYTINNIYTGFSQVSITQIANKKYKPSDHLLVLSSVIQLTIAAEQRLSLYK